MWLFLSDAMFSIVAAPGAPDSLLVRARLPGDIERVFPGHKVETTPSKDYRYRAVVPRLTVLGALTERLLAIDYDNFKNTVAIDDRVRHDAYLGVWGAMYAAQLKPKPRRRCRRGSTLARSVMNMPAEHHRPYWPYDWERYSASTTISGARRKHADTCAAARGVLYSAPSI